MKWCVRVGSSKVYTLLLMFSILDVSYCYWYIFGWMRHDDCFSFMEKVCCCLWCFDVDEIQCIYMAKSWCWCCMEFAVIYNVVMVLCCRCLAFALMGRESKLMACGDDELTLLLHRLILWFSCSNILHIGHILMLSDRLHVLVHMLIVMLLLHIGVMLMTWVDDIVYCWLLSFMDALIWWGNIFLVSSITYCYVAIVSWFCF